MVILLHTFYYIMLDYNTVYFPLIWTNHPTKTQLIMGWETLDVGEFVKEIAARQCC